MQKSLVVPFIYMHLGSLKTHLHFLTFMLDPFENSYLSKLKEPFFFKFAVFPYVPGTGGHSEKSKFELNSPVPRNFVKKNKGTFFCSKKKARIVSIANSTFSFHKNRIKLKMLKHVNTPGSKVARSCSKWRSKKWSLESKQTNENFFPQNFSHIVFHFSSEG